MNIIFLYSHLFAGLFLIGSAFMWVTRTFWSCVLMQILPFFIGFFTFVSFLKEIGVL